MLMFCMWAVYRRVPYVVVSETLVLIRNSLFFYSRIPTEGIKNIREVNSKIIIELEKSKFPIYKNQISNNDIPQLQQLLLWKEVSS